MEIRAANCARMHADQNLATGRCRRGNIDKLQWGGLRLGGSPKYASLHDKTSRTNLLTIEIVSAQLLGACLQRPLLRAMERLGIPEISKVAQEEQPLSATIRPLEIAWEIAR